MGIARRSDNRALGRDTLDRPAERASAAGSCESIAAICITEQTVTRARRFGRRDYAAQVCQKCEDTFSPDRLLVFCVAISIVVLIIVGAYLCVNHMEKMLETEHFRTSKHRAHIVQKVLGNKIKILVFTFQVIYQYSGIVTGYEHYFHYPEPARGAVAYLSMFGLELLNYSPPEVSVGGVPCGALSSLC